MGLSRYKGTAIRGQVNNGAREILSLQITLYQLARRDDSLGLIQFFP